ncbi:hypothetical protein ABZ568_00285 [Streptomyces olindensis]|uniref:Uncharacterized protein n=1 Tax=Streptomyces olindensis TaxID=358823 RepID=A0ABV2XLN0_9ACTN
MDAKQGTTLDVPAVERLCRRALYDLAPHDPGELAALVEQLEGHVRDLAPRTAQIVPRLRDNAASAARTTLRHADEVLDARAPRADAAARLHDLAVVARSLVTIVDMADKWSKPEQAEAGRHLTLVAAHEPPEE